MSIEVVCGREEGWNKDIYLQNYRLLSELLYRDPKE
jgi:hypothetical protein